MSEKYILPSIALRGLLVFPHTVLHFDVGREKSIKALEAAMAGDKLIFLATQKDEAVLIPTPDDYYEVGVVCKVKQMLKVQGDAIRVLVEGQSRAVRKTILREEPYIETAVETLEITNNDGDEPEVQAYMRTALLQYQDYTDLNEAISPETLSTLQEIDDPDSFADILSNHLDIKLKKKQEILEKADVKERLLFINQILFEEAEILGIEKDIKAKVEESVKQNQKEYILREQMKAITEELGYGEEVQEEAARWKEALKKIGLEEKYETKVDREINKFLKMPPNNADASVIRNYVETIIELPWNEKSKLNTDLKRAEKILNEDHYGLDKVKERILEYLAVVHLNKSLNGPIICLVGPPGVGKTSIAKSIARATGREFVRMSLGGVKDEAEIRGHRRTYIGAACGRVMQGIKDCGKNNPVFLFDEVDKIGADYKGDPASALLEVLDPEQNKDFTDHFLDIPFDLSNVMFITTANSVDTIPRPLLDRMELIEVSGYTEEEKVQIAEKYLVPKQIKANGLKKTNFSISERALRDLINYYTRESGVRNLEREIGSLARKVAKKIVQKKGIAFRISPSSLEDYLGKKRYRFDKVSGGSEVGVVTGMAWTQVGGDTLYIESQFVPGTGKIELTGQLGDVMQESAKAAITYIRSIASEYNIPEDFYKTYDLHVHVPEGAVPKDGPSAGVTMFTSVFSALTKTPVRKDIAMTGEITLRGNVLAVGGIKEKVLAAHRAGIKTILLPRDCEADIEDIPQAVRKKLKFVLIDKAKDVLEYALCK